MNNNELLFEIDNAITYANALSEPGLRALRAVVELHKPSDKGFDWLDKEWCSVCLQEQDDYMPPIEVKYPCPTIQAIEKELS